MWNVCGSRLDVTGPRAHPGRTQVCLAPAQGSGPPWRGGRPGSRVGAQAHASAGTGERAEVEQGPAGRPASHVLIPEVILV